MGEMLERFCTAVRRWDDESGVVESDGTGAWYVLGYLLERPEWRALVERELQELPTQAGMARCLAALLARGPYLEPDLLPQIVRAVDEQIERLSEDHAQIVRRKRRWLADTLRDTGADPGATHTMQASLTTEAVWEEMHRYRVYLTVWREVTAALV